MPHMFDILVKFRIYLTGLTADIEKAFHHIAVDSQDRDVLRFLWFDDVQKDHPNIIQYCFCRCVWTYLKSCHLSVAWIQSCCVNYILLD